ncbi:MAG: LysM domain-containing protein [Limnochordia bacterium]|jgi:hypothetical protein|nr:LysM peptidoglycan-binding domain-containing protein [Limnochordia bacterium]MDD2629455.1 LysM domain-containing protein [Limnochordia bacterium]MDD4517533.1 LysM domain-containing protein [Limnochordia bacterium]
MRKFTFAAMMLVIVLTLCSTLAAAAVRTYQVKAGDTLYSISLRTGVSVSELMRLNNITNPDTLSVGQVLVLDQGLPQNGQTGNDDGLLGSLWSWTQNYGWIGIFLLLKSVGIL